MSEDDMKIIKNFVNQGPKKILTSHSLPRARKTCLLPEKQDICKNCRRVVQISNLHLTSAVDSLTPYKPIGNINRFRCD